MTKSMTQGSKKYIWIGGVIFLCLLTVVVVLFHVSSSNKYANVSTTSTASTTRVKMPLDFSTYFQNEETYEKVSGITDSSTRDSITFTSIPDQESQNPSYYAFVNGQKIGEVEGMAIALPSFSPNGQYFVFRSRSMCGAGCEGFDVYVLDTVHLNVKDLILPTYREAASIGNDTRMYSDTDAFVESMTWNTDNTLDVVQYVVGTDNNGDYYRISPKEVWQYDLTTGKYTFVKDLPE